MIDPHMSRLNIGVDPSQLNIRCAHHGPAVPAEVVSRAGHGGSDACLSGACTAALSAAGEHGAALGRPAPCRVEKRSLGGPVVLEAVLWVLAHARGRGQLAVEGRGIGDALRNQRPEGQDDEDGCVQQRACFELDTPGILQGGKENWKPERFSSVLM